ncbi:MAG TPA: TonB-dependent receptor [Vitreimonas sp.]|uniref:TonB-dependent receptor n=1 Tax=Vitreimonas sp. TaxID=3069702 RepID=UPI002D5D13D9|nr:TonB-dependent receptor [Vitreimonas sp.]HYD87773.1 TonB-dependent receptor [Vitreimonas sp.]
MAEKSNSKVQWSLCGASLVALAMAVGFGAGPAFAQDADPAEEEEIVVTGFRASLEAAIDIKRDEAAAVDAIVAEDIADFPDLNLSESIQRIPGVAITRDAGEGRQISVRGLGPQFTRVRINGMEALATGGGTDAVGGTNRARSFDFNVFASELFNSITVRKSASAEVEEGALGATVDLRTALPFDYDGFTFAASGQGHFNDLSESTDPRVAILLSNRWDNGLGALLSVAYSDRESLEEGASTVRWQSGGFTTENTPLSLAQLNAAFHPRIPRYDVYQHEQERLGVTGALQWTPSNSTTFTLSTLYANFEGTRTESFLQAPVFSASGGSGIGGVIVQDAEIEGNTLVYGVFDNVDIRSELRFDELQTEFTQITLEGEHEIGDRVTVSGMAGFAESDHTNPIQTTLLFDANDIDGYVYDFRGNNRLPLITYGATDVTDPATWTLSQIRLRPQTAYNSYETLQGDIEFELNDVFTLKSGLVWRGYEFESTEQRRSNGTTSNQEGVIPGFAAATPISNYSMLMQLSGSGLSIPSGVPNQWLVPDISAAAALWDLYDTSVFPMGIEPALGNNFNVEEENRGGFVQLDWSSTEGRFRGNIGVRYVETEQTSTGYTFSAGLPVQTTTSREYDDIYPSMNLVVEPIDDLLFRFGASRVMSRPGLGFLNPGAAVTVSGNNRTVTAGNPELDPTTANAVDLSVEWYFEEGALLSFAYFFRDIDSFVQTVREDRPFTGNPLGLPDSVAIAACGATPGCDASVDWAFNLPRNTPGGPLQGYEIGLQLPFYFLPGVWSNFGLNANYTQVESDVDYVNSSGAVVLTGPLVGLSEESYNATVYYEDERFSARVSAAYRSDYPTTLPGRNGNATEATAETLNVDAAARYNLNDNFALTFEGVNLTDEVNDQYLTPDDRLSFYHHYGRSYFLGFRYTY